MADQVQPPTVEQQLKDVCERLSELEGAETRLRDQIMDLEDRVRTLEARDV